MLAVLGSVGATTIAGCSGGNGDGNGGGQASCTAPSTDDLQSLFPSDSDTFTGRFGTSEGVSGLGTGTYFAGRYEGPDGNSNDLLIAKYSSQSDAESNLDAVTSKGEFPATGHLVVGQYIVLADAQSQQLARELVRASTLDDGCAAQLTFGSAGNGSSDEEQSTKTAQESFELGDVVWHTNSGNPEGTRAVDATGVSSGTPSSYQTETAYAPVFTENAVIHGTQICEKSTGESVVQLPGESFVAPAVAGKQIYLPTGREGGLVAVDGTTGDEVWQYSHSSNPPTRVVATADAVVALLDGKLVALAPSDGSELWSVSVDSGYLSVHGGRAYVRGGVYDVAEGSEIQVEFDGEIDPLTYTTTTIAQDGSIYVPGSDKFMKYSNDGTRQWSLDVSTYHRFQASDATTVYVDDSQAFIALSADDGSERWSFETPQELDQGAPEATAVGSERAYLSYGTRLYALNKESGEREFVYQHGLRDSTPAVGGGVVSLFDESNGVAEILVEQS
jgi:outer membrane protein assembly factor BamB